MAAVGSSCLHDLQHCQTAHLLQRRRRYAHDDGASLCLSAFELLLRHACCATAVWPDLGWNDLGYQRGALPGQVNAIESPHIDSLALSGVRLHDYAVFKFCSPARSQFLTGRYAYHLGQQTKINLPCTVHAVDGTCGLPLGYSMIPAVLKRDAPEYISRAYGKW